MNSARHRREGERGAWSAMSDAAERPGRMRAEERLLECIIGSLMTFGKAVSSGGECRKQTAQAEETHEKRQL